MAANVLSLAPLTINSTTIAVMVTGWSPAIVESLSHHSGDLYPRLQVVAGASPRFTFSCHFQDIYSLVGFTVLSATTCSLYLAKFASLIRSASAVHVKLALSTSATAAIQILSVSTDQDGMLMAECEAVLLANDSTTNPLALTSNNALPALTAAPIIHTLGPLVLDSVGVPGVQNASLALNPTLDVRRSDGDLYPRVAAQLMGQPRLTIGHADPLGVLTATGLLGANLATSAIQYFRRYDATTGVASASNGVSFTIASARAHPVSISAGHGQVATSGIEISGLSASSTHPVAVSLVATVPAAA